MRPVVLAAAITSRLVGQVPDTTQRPSVVTGYVIDTVGTRLPGVEVLIMVDTVPVVPVATTDSQGNFLFRRVPAGPYTFIARKIGYSMSRGQGVTVPAGDTLRLRFVLKQFAVVLDPLVAKGKRDRNGIGADEIAAKGKKYRDFFDLVAWRRPFMLGDPYMCAALDSLGNPVGGEARIRLTRNLVLGPGQGGRKPRPADSARFHHGISDADELDLNALLSTYVRHVYVNGLQVDIEESVFVPGPPPHFARMKPIARVLRELPMHYVAQMRYVDCTDETVRDDMRYSLFVTLKPLLPAQVDSIYRRMLARAARVGPLPGQVLSVKHPSRQVWDSLVRRFTGRDSLADTAKPAPSP